MKELFGEEFEAPLPGPDQTAKTGQRVDLRKRFYKDVTVAAEADGFVLQLDGRGVRTPAKRLLLAPKLAIAEQIAGEWQAQQDVINPALMSLTRLSNSIIDGVADRTAEVLDDIAAYFGTDLTFYRADGPEGLVAREAQHWDPVVRWAADELGARFVLAEGIMHAKQPDHALEAARRALPQDVWRIGALHSVTTLTGSALLALALMHGFRDASAVWAAAHVDEDWNFEKWGADETVLRKRQSRERDLKAADAVLKALA